MTAPRPFAAFALVGAALLHSGCSLTTFDSTPCETTSECRNDFGLGSQCGSDGLCTAQQLHPRCSRSFPEDLLSDPTAARSNIVFGSLFDASNETHVAREQSLKLALRQINDEGGLAGQPFGVVLCSIEPGLEGESEPGTTHGALAAADYLVNVLEVPAIIGPASSADVLNVFESVRDSGTFIISPSATSPALTSIDRTEPTDESPGLLWRTAPPDSLQGAAIARDMTNRGIDSVAVIAEGGAYGEGLFEIFNETYDGFARLDTFRNANQRAQAIVAAGASPAQEVLFIASAQSDVQIFLRTLEDNAPYADKSIFLTDSAATQSVLSETPLAVAPRVRGTRPSQLTDSDFVFGVFRSSYEAEYNSAVSGFSFAAHTYDAAWVSMLGAAWSLLNEGSITGRGIARGARRLSAGDETDFSPSKWNGALQTFRQGRSIDVLGTSGALDFSPETEETSAPIDVWSLQLNGTTPVLAVVPE